MIGCAAHAYDAHDVSIADGVRLTTQGSWPGSVVIRHSWARADARPWNEDLSDAAIRLVRGGSAFLHEATAWLLDRGAPAALSPPLNNDSTRTWRKAGFEDHLELDLFRRPIAGPAEAPEWPIRQPRRPPWGAANRVDRDSFEPLWRLGELGLKEAFDAISRSVFLAVSNEEDLAGFAIVGTGGGVGYLQRIAVHPGYRHRGIGRALVRAAILFVYRHGGRSILLNTQPDNQVASALYESEGFVRDRRPLLVLRSG